ncbi:hypothetical protein IAQ61_001625 [Plenodomus lingam]|uniref:uncharacterized protein n=1 Tax=Leptosphaeria maculans TaxID=5022 RepID=UPI00331E9958|nr:hypothetical protein IAQ61_001625 [Plenodomus lingam]
MAVTEDFHLVAPLADFADHQPRITSRRHLIVLHRAENHLVETEDLYQLVNKTQTANLSEADNAFLVDKAIRVQLATTELNKHVAAHPKTKFTLRLKLLKQQFKKLEWICRMEDGAWLPMCGLYKVDDSGEDNQSDGLDDYM